MAFHHGMETIRVDGGSVPVATTDTAITGVIIASEKGERFNLKRCVIKKDFDQFGENETLNILQRYNAGTHYVVNIGALDEEIIGETEDETKPPIIVKEPEPEFKSKLYKLEGKNKDEITLEDKSLKDLEIFFKENLIDKTKYKFDKNTAKVKFTQSFMPAPVKFEQKVRVYKYKNLFTFNPARAEVKGAKKYTLTAPNNEVIKSLVFNGATYMRPIQPHIVTEFNLESEIKFKGSKKDVYIDTKTKEYKIALGSSQDSNSFVLNIAEDFKSVEIEFLKELDATLNVHISYEKLISSDLDLKYYDDGSSLKKDDFWGAELDFTTLIPEVKNPIVFVGDSVRIPESVYKESYTIKYKYTTKNIQRDIVLAGLESAFYYYGQFQTTTPFRRRMQDVSIINYTHWTLNSKFSFEFLSQEKDLHTALGIKLPEIEDLKVEYTTVIPKKPKPQEDLPAQNTTTPLAPKLSENLLNRVLRGILELKQGFLKFGIDAKVILAPSFDQHPAVASALFDMADKIKARAYIDADASSLEDLLTKRGQNSGNLILANERTYYYFPKVKGANGKIESLAAHAAGLRMLIDCENGYWHSTSNKNLRGVVGGVINLYARPDDIKSETNAINAVGITTIFNSFGTGFRLWGNRASCYPTVTHIKNFEVALAVGDYIDENIKRVELQYLDRPINQAVVDSLLYSIDTFMRTLPSIAGYKIGLNHQNYDLVDAFSKGQIPLFYEYTPIIPAERITNESVMTREYLINLIKKA